MTDKPNLSRLLDGVPRWTKINGQEVVGPPLLDEADVLAALSAALPADVAAVVEEAGELLPDLQRAADDGDIDCKEAVRLIRALIALAAAQQAQIGEAKP